MSTIFTEGFDKYGMLQYTAAQVLAEITQGEWTSTTCGFAIANPLSTTGFAMAIGGAAGQSLNKTLNASYNRVIGGLRFNSPLGGNNTQIQFTDGTTTQCSIRIAITGLISVIEGSSGTTLATSTLSITANTTHFIEWDITIGVGSAGSYKVWLDGVLLLSGTGTTQQSANSTLNVFSLVPSTPWGSTVIFDDIYLFNSSGTVNNAVLLSNPRIESKFAVADTQAQFTSAAFTFGIFQTGSIGSAGYTTNYSPGQMYLVSYTPTVSGTLNGITVYAGASSGQVMPVVYGDSGGLPHTLLGQGPGVVNSSIGYLTLPLTASISVTAGTPYWIGFMVGTATISFQGPGNVLNTGREVSGQTFGSPPSTAPSMTGGQLTLTVFANCTGASHNFASVDTNPVEGTYSFVATATVGNNDLYQYPAPSVGVQAVYCVAVKGHAELSATGSHNISMRALSGAVNSSGSLGSVALSSSFIWYGSYFDLDPNINLPWTPTSVAAASFGPRLDS